MLFEGRSSLFPSTFGMHMGYTVVDIGNSSYMGCKPNTADRHSWNHNIVLRVTLYFPWGSPLLFYH